VDLKETDVRPGGENGRCPTATSPQRRPPNSGLPASPSAINHRIPEAGFFVRMIRHIMRTSVSEAEKLRTADGIYPLLTSPFDQPIEISS
jgi:hypothetical protein